MKKDIKYKLLKVIDTGNCHAEVYVPERTPEEEAKRMEEIKEATAEFLKAVYQERARAAKERQQTEEAYQ